MTEKGNEMTKSEDVAKRDTNWLRVLFQLYIHSCLLYGLYFFPRTKLLTMAFTVLLMLLGVLGTTAGAHRLWAHNSYSANALLKLFLMLCHTLGGTGTIYDWVLDHRIHHKFHGTSDDPFNYKSGVFYAHLGNQCIKENPRKPELVKEIDMSDIESDKIVMFQKRFYWVLMPIFTLLLPLNAPVEYWGEDLLLSFMATLLLRIPIMYHVTWLVNSARSVWGLKPNDRFFSDSNLVFIIKKSYWHEYHYTVPWDCLTGEFGSYNCGCTTGFIKIWAVMGLASDLKTIDSRGVTRALEQAMKTGKPICDCIKEAREETLLYQYEDCGLNIIESKQSTT